MYMQASTHRPNQKARLTSPTYPGSTTKCLKFWYNMYGSDVGTFNVYVKNGNNLGAPFLTFKGNQGQGWQLAEMTVPQYGHYAVSK